LNSASDVCSAEDESVIEEAAAEEEKKGLIDSQVTVVESDENSSVVERDVKARDVAVDDKRQVVAQYCCSYYLCSHQKREQKLVQNCSVEVSCGNC